MLPVDTISMVNSNYIFLKNKNGGRVDKLTVTEALTQWVMYGETLGPYSLNLLYF